MTLDPCFDDTCERINELLVYEPELIKTLNRFSDDRAVRILTVHKSKGLEFRNVIFMAVEEETFWGKESEERCAFFVGVSRAKDKLLLTYANQRYRPDGYTRRWDVSRTPHEEYLGYALAIIE